MAPTPPPTPTPSLTDRYLSATVRSLPAAAQEDVRRELSASIAEDVEARTDQGEDAVAAERAVLTELGDPAVLAARFAERPLHLIGPRFYLQWWNLLRVLLAIVPVCVLAAVALGQTLAGAGIGQVIGQSLGISLSVAVHLCFWVTVVFAVLERTGADTGLKWDLDQLPEPKDSGAGRADTVASIVLVAAAAGALLWDSLRGLVHADGRTMSFLDPQLWPGVIALLLGILVLEVVLAVLVFARGRWTPALALANTALGVLFLSWTLTLLGRGRLVNPEVIEVLRGSGAVDAETWRVLGVLLGFVVAGVVVWDSVDSWIKARRAGR